LGMERSRGRGHCRPLGLPRGAAPMFWRVGSHLPRRKATGINVWERADRDLRHLPPPDNQGFSKQAANLRARVRRCSRNPQPPASSPIRLYPPLPSPDPGRPKRASPSYPRQRFKPQTSLPVGGPKIPSGTSHTALGTKGPVLASPAPSGKPVPIFRCGTRYPETIPATSRPVPDSRETAMPG
jgi:hypothetical protein